MIVNDEVILPEKVVQHERNEIQIVDLKQETEQDRETISIVLARYNHLFKYLFKQYVCTGYSRKHKESIEATSSR